MVYLYSNVIFYLLLYNIYKYNRDLVGHEDSIRIIIKPYIALTLITLVGSVIMFVLLKAGVSPMVNDVSYKYDLFLDNAEKFQSTYFYPYYLSIVEIGSGDIRIPFFQDTGFITGLYHEPHCMTFMTFPALPLMLYYSYGNKKKIAVTITLFVILLCLAGSTTNIAAVLCCVYVYSLYSFKSSFIKSVFLWTFLLLIVVFIMSFVDLTVFDFIFNKLESGSMTYSMSTIDFAIKPRTLFGTSFFNLGYLSSGIDAQKMDVGYIPFVLNILFLAVCFIYMLKLFRTESKFKLALLISSVYFFAHSAKVAMVAYSLTMLMFIVFLLTIEKGVNEKG
ncbi:MAG: hypothetical protein KBT06_05710 [Prevotellaceae bacterium]|nr:hypothetical protein [Candidatus Colivivens equi]